MAEMFSSCHKYFDYSNYACYLFDRICGAGHAFVYAL